MKLTTQQKKLLAILDDAPAEKEKLKKIIKNFIRISEKKLQENIEEFKKKGLIKKVKLTNENEEIYFWTKKVTKEMIDLTIRNKRDNEYLDNTIKYEIKEEKNKKKETIITAVKETPITKKQQKIILTIKDKEEKYPVISINKKREYYEIGLASKKNKEAGTIRLTKETLSEWTCLSTKEIEEATKKINLTKTYNLITRIPKIILIKEKKIIIKPGEETIINEEEMIKTILENKNPFNRKQ